MLLDQLESIKNRWLNLQDELNDPSVISNQKKYAQLSKEYKELQKLVYAYESYKLLLSNIDHSKQILVKEKDEDLRELAKEELPGLEEQKEKQAELIRQLLVPKDPQDDRNAVVEIRAGTGGDEAALFAGDLFRMYLRFC